MDFTTPQNHAMHAYYRKYGKEWISSIMKDEPIESNEFHEGTLGVVKRKLKFLLDMDYDAGEIFCNGVFDLNSGITTINDVCDGLEKGETIIIDTSTFSGQAELLIGSLIATEVLRRYKTYQVKGVRDKPVVSIVLEEAPRVLGKEVLEQGSNVFSTIAREGRKFGVGLTAITQMPSLIPRVILANMNTKIILGTEMNTERQAIIESAAQDLSSDGRSIASLDKGEAIITSNFARFALPVSIPFFDEEVKKEIKKEKVNHSFSGVKS
jgi:DNA helicase HerA-like ATPase